MDLDDSPEQATYRAEVREWLAEHRHEAPAPMGDMEDSEYIEARRTWQRQLSERQLVGVTWPSEFGGPGRGPVEQLIVNQELVAAGVPGGIDVIGLGLMGPCIMVHGTPAQKERYLAPLLHGDEVWCQLFSEPAAGSDLAAVQCRARRGDDGSWRLTGQKVWTTNAQFARFGMCLARTDGDQPKHKGLTMFVVPMDADGVTVRGLRQISGEAEFNEVFLDDVVVGGDEMVMGEVGGGWGAALTVLMYERMMIGLGTEGFGYSPERFAGAVAGSSRMDRESGLRAKLADVAAELLAVRFRGFQSLSQLEDGRVPGPEFGLAKITTVNAAITAGDLIADVNGPDALVEPGEWAYHISFLPGLKSAGGAEPILRNTVGERVLGMPPEPRLDKNITFDDLVARQREGIAA
ncbi:acyl-CoA dehydrogenase family protein [Patulibacter brassicae]|jgi:alkylation response protein AidB-like acyl-CoA dehydrogenase|uniref:Acyl-CoA dehydrogenase family protein n=1 Tax=Patulibacter brassicae TaxID=1705717 RepID=A0ABU4VFT6_9ACTN|nr:acyl-CoA dehydrogenase family protein [Patulibacter brassicae]MDX8150685.1 acyl-CoA dehydrogenase family protein [Patulibacter brassicae]